MKKKKSKKKSKSKSKSKSRNRSKSKKSNRSNALSRATRAQKHPVRQDPDRSRNVTKNEGPTFMRYVNEMLKLACSPELVRLKAGTETSTDSPTVL